MDLRTAVDGEEHGMMDEEENASAAALASDPEAAVVNEEERRSLHSSFPRHVGYISLLFSLGNVALQLFSHLSTSATFLSSIPYERDAPAMGIGLPNVETTCADDRSGFDEWWELRGKDKFFDYAQTCGPSVLVGDDQYFACLIDEGYNSTKSCLDCFLLPIDCVMTSCLGTCLAMGVESVGCVDCLIENNCDGPFEACAGVSVGLDEWVATPAARMLQEANGENDSSPTVLYEVYSISFVDSIRDAANGGAWWLVIILACLSGIWPYLKNVIMMVAWFVPMTTKQSRV